MASALISRASRRFLKSSLLPSSPSTSLYPSIVNPLISSQQCVAQNPSLNLSLTPFMSSHPGTSNVEFCSSIRSLSNFQFVMHISSSPSGLGGSSKGNEDKSSSSVSSRGDISWIDLYLPRSAQPYARLARLDKPIGTWLLLWPCIW